MNNQFDELTKSMAQSVTRRAALKRFGVGLAGMVLACFGLATSGKAAPTTSCATDSDCNPTGDFGYLCCNGRCVSWYSDKNCGACGRVCPHGTKCRAIFGFPDCYGRGAGWV